MTLSERFTRSLIRRVRGDSDYELDPRITGGELRIELWNRAIALLRAQWKLIRVPGGRARFVERGVSIRHRRHLSVGRGTVLEAGTRLSCLSTDGVALGRSVTLGRGVVVKCTGVLRHKGAGLAVGDHSSVGDYSYLGCSGGITIGENVLVGQHVCFHSQNHNFERVDTTIGSQGTSEQGIRVGDDCWIGSGAIVLDGVELGPGCVVAAGSVVNRSFDPGSVVAGVPAEVVRSREST